MAPSEYEMDPQNQRNQPQTQEGRWAGNPHAQPTTQAERAVMHPQSCMFGREDHHDPDWRHYFACGA